MSLNRLKQAILYVLVVYQAFRCFRVCSADHVSLSARAKETCPSTDLECNARSKGNYKLVQLEGVKPGFVQYVTIEGITYKLITRSMRPLLFEIPKFLTDEECDRIVRLANKKGLEESETLDVKDDGLTNETDQEKDVKSDDSDDSEEQLRRHHEHCSEMMEDYDMDKNQQLSIQELENYFKKSYSPTEFKQEDVVTMIEALNLDKDGDGELSHQECMNVNVTALEEYMDNVEESNPLYWSRYSQQAWLKVDNGSDSVLVRLQERVVQLTKLPRKMIAKSEQLQVVRYSVNGHFHAHYDSSFNKNKSCCNQIEEDVSQVECNLCRFLTILYYLNNVTKGGETAFPIADNTTFDNEKYEKEGLSNLSTKCHLANIVVKPVQGTAILWYNHDIDPDTDYMGVMDKYSLHGGCAVHKGIKWIANNWINSNTHT